MIRQREIGAEPWKAFAASFLGWVLDGFDFTMLAFVLGDIQRAFGVSKALVGALGTVSLIFRVVGGVAAGTAADRVGRRWPLACSIVWFSACAFLSGFSTSYRMLFALRGLFGIGMGGVWAAGMPLAIEHWPARLRGTVSGLLQAGFSIGFVLSALVYQFVYPSLSQHGRPGWRAMLWLGACPAVLGPWIIWRVKESPVWLERRRSLEHDRAATGESRNSPGASTLGSLRPLFAPPLLATTIHASLVMGAFLFSYYALSFWYASLLEGLGRPPLPFLIALNVGGVAGSTLWGRLSETRLGRRGASTLAMSAGLAATPFYVSATGGAFLWTGALVVGIFAAGSLGIAPGYLSERFPTSVRAAGAGLAYHVGAAVGAFPPYLVGALQDAGARLDAAMAGCMYVSGLLLVVLMWMGPETRGRSLPD